MARADTLAQDLSVKDVDGFWKTMNKMNSCNTILELMRTTYLLM